MLHYILCTLRCGTYANDLVWAWHASCFNRIPFSFLIISCPKPPEIPWLSLVHEQSKYSEQNVLPSLYNGASTELFVKN